MDVSRLATKRTRVARVAAAAAAYLPRSAEQRTRVPQEAIATSFRGGRSLAGGRPRKSAGSECVTVARRDARRRKSSNARPNAAPFVDGRRPGCGRDGARRETDERAGRTAYCELRAASCEMRNTKYDRVVVVVVIVAARSLV